MFNEQILWFFETNLSSRYAMFSVHAFTLCNSLNGGNFVKHEASLINFTNFLQRYEQLFPPS